MKLFARLAVMAAMVVAVGACSDSSGPDEGGSIAGTYSLRTVNGSNLPFTVVQLPEFKVEVVSDVVTLNANNTFSEVFTSRTTEGTTVTTESETTTGTYTLTGSLLRMTDTEGNVITAAFSAGNTLTATAGNFTLVYRK